MATAAATLPRPTSSKHRPTSSSSSTRPASGRPTSRPQSAVRLPETLPYNDRALVYTNLTNSFHKLKVKPDHYWRNKSSPKKSQKDTREPIISGRKGKRNDSETVEKENEQSKKPASATGSRNNRSAHFIRFKYPQHFHRRPRPNQSALEQVIPESLRQFPRYTLLPMRQNCTHSPWASVTYLSSHSIRSFALPHPKTEEKGMSTISTVKDKEISELLSARAEKKKPEAADESADDDKELERNKNSSFVYGDNEEAPNTAYEVELGYEDDFETEKDKGDTPRKATEREQESSDDSSDTTSNASQHSATILGPRSPLKKLSKVESSSSDSSDESIADETTRGSKTPRQTTRESVSDASEVDSDY